MFSAGNTVEIRSAGSLPGERAGLAAVKAMAEVRTDISDQRSELLTTDTVQSSDGVITIGSGSTCPAPTIQPARRADADRPVQDVIERRSGTPLAGLLDRCRSHPPRWRNRPMPDDTGCHA